MEECWGIDFTKQTNKKDLGSNMCWIVYVICFLISVDKKKNISPILILLSLHTSTESFISDHRFSLGFKSRECYGHY